MCEIRCVYCGSCQRDKKKKINKYRNKKKFEGERRRENVRVLEREEERVKGSKLEELWIKKKRKKVQQDSLLLPHTKCQSSIQMSCTYSHTTEKANQGFSHLTLTQPRKQIKGSLIKLRHLKLLTFSSTIYL